MGQHPSAVAGGYAWQLYLHMCQRQWLLKSRPALVAIFQGIYVSSFGETGEADDCQTDIAAACGYCHQYR